VIRPSRVKSADLPTIQPIAVTTIQTLKIRWAISQPIIATKAYKMNEPYAWIPAEIKCYNSLYRGRRFWVFENDFARPYDIYDDPEWHQILLFDCAIPSRWFQWVLQSHQ
jgi:hypothetical protein